MSKYKNIVLVLLRVSLGWLFFYAGITKVVDPSWTSAGYLSGAKILTGFYGWLASPGVLPVVDFLNQWGLTLIGVALILGLYTRVAAYLGALMMFLYYLPLGIIHPNEHSLVVDDHVIYIFAFLYLALADAGQVMGLDGRRKRR